MNSFAPLMTIEAQFDFLNPLKNTQSLSPTASSYTSSHSPKLEASKSSSPSGVARVVTTVAVDYC